MNVENECILKASCNIPLEAWDNKYEKLMSIDVDPDTTDQLHKRQKLQMSRPSCYLKNHELTLG